MKYIKIPAFLILAGIVLSGCDNKSEPSVSAQIFAVLTQQTAVAAGPASVTANSLDASVTADGRGGVDVNGTEFTGEDLLYTRANSYVFQKAPVITTIGNTTTTVTQKLVLGGARKGLKYGDYGYWTETTETVTLGVKTVSDQWSTLLIYDPANMSQNIPTNDNTNYAFTGRILGGVDLFDENHSGAYVKTGELTGDITVNANFKTGNLDGTMNMFIDNGQWYTADITSTSGVTSGAFTGSVANLSGSVTGDFARPTDGGTGYTSYVSGQFMGADGAIPQELLGQFNIIFNAGTKNANGYRPEVYGVYGAKR